MTIKTFDANRVGGGTFQIVQDPLTGDYKVEEVGYLKLPELKLPEIDQAAYTVPDPTPDDPTGEDPTDPGSDGGGGSGGGGSGGGGDNQQDFTGATTLRNIGKEATTSNLVEDAKKFAGQDTGIQVENLTKNPEENTALLAYNQSLKLYNDAIAKTDTKNPNEMKNVDEAKALVDRNRKFYEQSIAPGALFFEGNIPNAPIGDFSKGPKTVPTGTLTGGLKGVPDMIVQGQPSLPDQNIFSKAKDVVSNTKPVQLLGMGITTATKAMSGVADAVLGVTEIDKQRQKNAMSFFDNVSSKNYKTKGELGSNIDPGRLAGNPSVDLFAGMNKVSAKGNLEKAGAKRIATRKATIAKKGIKSATNPNGVSQEFVDNTNNMEKELTDMQNHNNNENIKSYNKKKDAAPINQLNPNEMRNVAETGDPGGDPGGKIVCTMMNQRYGFGSFRNKIWLKFHKDYSPEYQKGYHKVFLPLVNIAKKEGIFNTIVRKILEHMGRHVTADMFQVMRNKKSDKLGRIYRKIFEPICYWLGGK